MAKSLEPQRFQGFFFCPDLAFFNSCQGAPYGLKRVNFSEWVNRWVKNGLIFHPLSCPFRTAEPSGQPPIRPILFLYKYEQDSKTVMMETSLFPERLYGKSPPQAPRFEALAGAIFFSAEQLHLVRPSRDVTTATGPTQPEWRDVGLRLRNRAEALDIVISRQFLFGPPLGFFLAHVVQVQVFAEVLDTINAADIQGLAERIQALVVGAI